MRAKVIAVLIVLFAAAGGYWLWSQRGEMPPSGDADPSTKFALADASERSLDGAPALALTFTQPLDARKSYDQFIQVLEMPGRPSEQPTTEAQRGAEEEDGEDEGTSGDSSAKQSAVSTAPEDTETEGGKAVSGAWVVGENPRLLFFPHIKPQTRYVVRVNPGVLARNGSTLAAEARYSIRTAAVSPAYYFASRGMVLPAKQNGGLPVVTVNVPEVDVQFLRVKSGQLPRFLEEVIGGRVAKQQDAARNGGGTDEADADEGDGSYGPPQSLQGAVGNYRLDALKKLTESVYLGRFLTEQRANRRSVTYLPVEEIKELQEPGVYVVIMSQPGRFRYDYQATYYYVSDLGLHLRLYNKGSDVFVSSLTDGKAVKGVEVSWLDQQGKVLARAESDGDGRAAFAERPKGAKVVLARKERQVSMIALKEPALDLSEYDVVGPPYKPVRLFAYSGRNLYRPGESFDLSVLARDADGRAVPAQPIQAVLKRPDGKSQLTATWQPDAKFSGYYSKRLELPADAPTGFWNLELRADPADKVPGTVFRFGVEEFLPERMKLDLASRQTTLSPEQPLIVGVTGSYLYGAPASGNRLLGVAQFERSRNPLAGKYPGFEFGDVSEDSARTRQELPETVLDEQGATEVKVDLSPAAKRRSAFAVRATFSLLESGGRPVVRTIERVIWPAPLMVAVRPLFAGDYARENSSAEFEVVRVDQNGNEKPAAGLPVRLFREDRHYYWRFEDQRGWHSGFTETDELVETAAVSVPAGARGKLAVPVRYGRYRLEVLDPETGQTLRFRFYAGWSAKADETQGVRPDRVGLKLDKPGYREGETARLSITPPHAGEALVTVEGERALWVKRMTIAAEGATIDIALDKEWRRHDLYVSVLVLRPGNQGERVTPARALGLVHLPLERGERKINVTLEAPQKIQPEKELKVKVKAPEAKGEKALVTLSAVDVGILNITRFASPDPYAYFFGKLRYGADQYDVYGRLIEKMPGQKGRLKFGGDNVPKPTRSLPKKVKLVDLFSAPVALNDQGEAEIALSIPDFNGTLRLMAVVAGGERFGAKDAEVTVAAPLVVELATPRFLTFGDTATVALDLHNLSGMEQSLKVSLASGDGLRIQEAERSVLLKDQQKTTLRFALEAGNVAGLIDTMVKVEGQEIKLARSFPLTVQAPSPLQQITKRYNVGPGDTLELKDPSMAGLHKASALAHVVISNRPPIDIRSAIQGLLTYPYGCAEQTTSTAYPHVFVDEDAARRFGLKPYSREKRSEMLERAISRIAALQAPNGGFSLWGNVSEYEYWLSAYVAQFLLDAREQGFGVPEAMQRKATDFLLRGLQEGVTRLPATAASPSPAGGQSTTSFWDDPRYRDAGRFGVLAYGAYVLARESKAPLATLRQLHEARAQAHSGLPLIHLGIALRLMGDEPRGDAAIAEGLKKGRDAGYWWHDYGSPVRDAALSYALLERHKIPAEGRENLTAVIAGELEKQRYFSTQEKMALFLVGRSFAAADGGSWKAGIVSGGKTGSISTQGSHFRELSVAELAAGIGVANNHNERLYVELAIQGHSMKPPAPKNDPIALGRSMFAPDGTALGNRPFKVGESVMVRLTVKSKTPIANGLVVDRIPAGLEIENLNIVQGEGLGAVQIGGVDPAQAMKDGRIKHVEFRDDRFVAAARLDGNDLNLFYRARVVTPGKFIVPPLYVEDMYRPDIFGLAGGTETIVVVDSRSGDAAAKTTTAAPGAR